VKAARIHQYGEIDAVVLEEVRLPEISPTKVLVKVVAASINPPVVQLIRGALQAYFPLAMPYSVSSDLSGTVVRDDLSVHSVAEVL
jgi:NADPH:quinone reductase-like Zn-dependent oxidoreductase